MEYLYTKIEICKALQNEKECINYYVTRGDLFGIKITRALPENSLNNQEIIINNISANEKDVKDLIDSIITSGNDLSQIGYVVDDYKNQFSNKL